jgi:hypothetical protein
LQVAEFEHRGSLANPGMGSGEVESGERGVGSAWSVERRENRGKKQKKRLSWDRG